MIKRGFYLFLLFVTFAFLASFVNAQEGVAKNELCSAAAGPGAAGCLNDRYESKSNNLEYPKELSYEAKKDSINFAILNLKEQTFNEKVKNFVESSVGWLLSIIEGEAQAAEIKGELKILPKPIKRLGYAIVKASQYSEDSIPVKDRDRRVIETPILVAGKGFFFFYASEGDYIVKASIDSETETVEFKTKKGEILKITPLGYDLKDRIIKVRVENYDSTGNLLLKDNFDFE